MSSRVKASTQNLILGTTALEVLSPNPKRRSFLISPIAGGQVSGTPIIATVFPSGAGQTWTVPAGVTQMIAAYAWGSGGNSGVAAAGLGGGGGAGGAFASSGPKTVVPGQTWTVNVPAGGAGGVCTVINPTATTVASAGSGATAVLDVHGAGGTATIGTSLYNGGDGGDATALAGQGAGAGGAGGTYAAGAAAAGAAGGPGGGGTTLSVYGTGGGGFNGQGANMDGTPGGAPGGGGSGGGDGSAIVGAGADGMAVIIYVPADTVGYISLSHKANVVAGAGVLNFITGQTFPTIITREEIGDAVGMPWYAISSVAGIPFQIMEILCEDDCNA